jgi:uncharacterized protein
MSESDRTLLGEGPIYVDSSALVKVYLPEPDSSRVDDLLRKRTDLIVSDLVLTEIVSAAARRMREGDLTREDVITVRQAILDDVRSERLRLLDLDSETHREAERLLVTLDAPLRAADSLHLTLALGSRCSTIMTFDAKLSEAARHVGMAVFP